MNEAIIAKKAAIVDKVSEKFTAVTSVVVVNYRGLTVGEITHLYEQLRDANVRMRVTKNPILSRTAKKAGLGSMDEVLTRPTVVVFNNEDVVAPAKVMGKFAKGTKVLEIKDDAIEGEVFSLGEITALVKLPNYEGLLSMLLSVLRAPIRNVACAVRVTADKEDGDVA